MFYVLQTPDCSSFTNTSEVCGGHATDNPYSTIPGYFADNQEEAENKLSDISNIVSQCDDENNTVMDFFCRAAYRTCSNNDTLFPRHDKCVQIQNETCREQWRELESVSSTLTCCNAYNPYSTCPDQFARFCGICAPVCHQFSQHPDATRIGIDAIIAIAMIIGNFVFGVIVFIAAFIKRKTM